MTMVPNPARILLAAGGLWLGAIPHVHASDMAEPALKGEVTIAVRDDARPFAWKDETSGKFLGFFWDICTEAVVRSKYKFHHFGVNATQRSEFILTGKLNPNNIPGETSENSIDLLCDPTTINLERLRRFGQGGQNEELSFSPIIFVANGSYIKTKHNSVENIDKSECNELIGEERLDDPPASGDDSPWIALRPAPVVPKVTYEVWGYVVGTTIREAVRAEAKETAYVIECLKEFKSHTQAAYELCDGKLHRYFGDADIVTATIRNLNEINAELKRKCFAEAENIVSGGTYEPYAFIVSNAKYRDFPEEYAIALYEMFADRTVERIFAGHFSDARSPHLETLFLINRVPVGNIPERGKAGTPLLMARGVSGCPGCSSIAGLLLALDSVINRIIFTFIPVR